MIRPTVAVSVRAPCRPAVLVLSLGLAAAGSGELLRRGRWQAP